MRKQRWPILKNVVLVTASLFFSALVAEIALRFYVDLFSPKMMLVDDSLGWRHAVNAKKTFTNEFGEKVLTVLDEYGHRGSGHPKKHPDGKYRILALGDSFTEGVQVGEADVFTAQLERADSSLDVINAGVAGYGTVQEYLYYKSEGVQFHPDLVLLMLFGNDLTDNLLTYYPGFGPRPYATWTGEGLHIIQTLDAAEYKRFILPAPFQMALNKHSYSYYLANSRLYQPIFASRMKQMQQQDISKMDSRLRYDVFFGVLDQFRDFLEEQKTAFAVVIIPTREEVAAGHSEVASVVGQRCRTQKMNCLPLLETLSDASPAYFQEDIHWTKKGHMAAATQILTYIRLTFGEPLSRFQRPAESDNQHQE